MPMPVGQWTSASSNGLPRVEVLDTGAAIMQRDQTGNILVYTYDEWMAFLAGVLEDKFTPAHQFTDGVPPTR